MLMYLLRGSPEQQRTFFLTPAVVSLWRFGLPWLKSGGVVRGQGLALESFAFSSPVKYVLAHWKPHVLPCLKTHWRLILSHTHVGRRHVTLSEAQKYTIFSSGCQSPLLSLFLQPLHHSLFPSWSLCVRTLLMIHVLIPLCQGPRAASITPRPCLLLASRALTLYTPPPHIKKHPFVIVSNSDAVSSLEPDSKSCFSQQELP